MATSPMPVLDDSFLDELRELRRRIRDDEGGGGMCHFVSECIQMEYGWQRFMGTYTAIDGDVICSAHLWNILPDGSILDATADQFGEGHDIRIIATTDPDYDRYRYEFNIDFHPKHPDFISTYPQAAEAFADWGGEFDENEDLRLWKERGDYWWVEDKSHAIAYLTAQDAHREAYHSKRGRYPLYCEKSFLSRLGEPDASSTPGGSYAP